MAPGIPVPAGATLWPEARLDEVRGALGRVRWRAFEYEVGGLGGFPDLRRPRVVFAKVAPHPQLTALVEEIARRLAEIGIEREARPFTPHVTLGRVKKPGGEKGIAALAGTFRAERFALYESRSGRFIELAWYPAGPA